MSKRATDIDLMLHHDGELDESSAAEVSARLSGDDEARVKVEALEQVSEAVRTHLELAADEAEPALDALWSRIERRIGANGEADEPAVAAPRRQPSADPGVFGAIGAWFDKHRGNFLTGAATAAAVAALFLVLRPTERVVVEREPVVQQRPTPTVVAPATASTPPEIEYLEVVGGSGSVLSLPSEEPDGSDATIIWLMPDEDNVEGPI